LDISLENRIMNRLFFTAVILLLALGVMPVSLASQEALKSATEEYYDFLSLLDLTERPALGYRSLSDSVWAVPPDARHPWQEIKPDTRYPISASMAIRIYSPELFMSVNTASPYGQNDGALWQGRGFNSSLTGGARFEGYGVELTFKPSIAFSQNQAFDYIDPSPAYRAFGGKAAVYGYYGIPSIDAPQRFGNEPLFAFDFGDSEIRYSWKTLTVGFGTQTLWLGPARINPIIHSNNAPSYPKFDLGIRRQPMVIPRLNWHIGDIEARAWWGYLSESDWFDDDESNDHNLITGFSAAYSFPWLLKGLSLGLNRIMLSKWNAMNYKSIFALLIPDMMIGNPGEDENDQRVSFTVDYVLPIGGINVYLEWARNDSSPSANHLVRYPFHTEAWTVGARKALNISDALKGEILLELTKLEGSQDYGTVVDRATTFYAHHIITQGHTNRGQWLGAGTGTGGNSQYLGFKLYFPQGYGQIFFQRRNPDLDYTWYIDSKAQSPVDSEENVRAALDFGIAGMYFIRPDFSVSSSFVLRDEFNPLNVSDKSDGGVPVHRYNVYISLGLKYVF
jgi:hypothetical protein